MKQPNIVPEHTVAPGGETVPHEFLTGGSPLDREPETAEEAEAKGPSAAWTFWNQQIAAALTHEKLFRAEGEATERMYFGLTGKDLYRRRERKRPHQDRREDGTDPC